MPNRKSVNVEPGKKGFQPTRAGSEPPTAAPDSLGHTTVVTAPQPAAVDYEQQYVSVFGEAAPGVDVDAVLDAKRVELESEKQRLAEATRVYERCERKQDNAWSAYRDYREAQNPELRRLTDEANTAVDEGREAARRIYVEAGVSERHASTFSWKISESAKRENEWGPGSRRNKTYEPVKPLRFLGKRRIFADEVSAAANSAKKDAGWKAASQKVKEALRGLKALENDPEAARLDREWGQARSALREAERVRLQAEARVALLRSDVADLQSRKENGVPVDTHDFPVKDITRNRTSVTRNPDGSTNAWAKISDPTTGSVRHVPITGICVERVGVEKINMLVTSEGERLFQSESWANEPGRSGIENTTPTHVAIVTSKPARGARPLVEEGDPSLGFRGLMDSTD